MSLWLFRVGWCLSWSAPKAMEHGLMQPDPIESRMKHEKRKASCVGVGGLQLVSGSLQEEGVNGGSTAVNQREVIPYHTTTTLLLFDLSFIFMFV
ncbi:hypothetical protein HanIR_Chr04g0188881 [Helianthus annuus]|nr:hypothetical protein HanIR_Chr04g0188881 [Helianthus annuus]